MLKKILSHPSTLAGLAVFVLLSLIGVFALGLPLSEAVFFSFILTVVGMAVVWWQTYIA